MSTTRASASQTTSSSPPSSTPSQSDSDTATLYLFTFLATILILVLLSASLVLRSYILRRQYRRRFQRALSDALSVDLDRGAFDDGTSPFDPVGFHRGRRLGPKPVFRDAWIHRVNGDTWSAFTPVAVCCTPSSLPSTWISSPQPSMTSPASLSSVEATTSLLNQLRLPPPFSLTHIPSQRQIHTLTGSSTISNGRSRLSSLPTPPSAPSNLNNDTEKDPATLSVCVLVAMPDVSARIHRPVPDVKGKGTFEAQAPQQGGDADPLLLSSMHRSGAHLAEAAPGEEGLPLLEFGVAEVKMGEWA